MDEPQIYSVERPLKRERRPTHPGEYLKEMVLPALGLPMTQVAAELSISRNQLYKVLRGKAPVTPETAVKLSRWLGGSAESWTRMQMAVDLYDAERRLADRLDHIPCRAERPGAAS